MVDSRNPHPHLHAGELLHGSNDGQKGMGLIMLILIGTVPTAYALNRAMPESEMRKFATDLEAASKVIEAKGAGHNVLGNPRPAVTALRRQPGNQRGYLSFAGRLGARYLQPSNQIRVASEIAGGTRRQHPQRHVSGSEAIRFLMKDKASELSEGRPQNAESVQVVARQATKFIPTWVKIAVAISLGLGTMIGWKRIVITVGEKIGKTHLTYAQGACAEITAAATIAAADMYGLPVSTTHVLSSGIAGTMAANGSGLQLSTVRNIALAWVLTLPAAMVISGTLYWAFWQSSEPWQKRHPPAN